jgi:hypothetical protein
MNKSLTTLMAAGALIAAQQAQAVSILPGATVVPGAAPKPDTTLLASSSFDFDLSDPSPIKGTLFSEVWTHDGDTSATTTGNIFVYRIQLTAGSPVALGRLSVTGWEGWAADVLQDALGGHLADSANRDDLPADVIGFNFDKTPNGFDSPEFSAWLMIASDANSYTDATANFINGGIDNKPTFAPANITTPDGGTTAIMLALSMFGIAGLRRKLS